ncbi:endonuclease/exonuclease/phosphatase family protein [Rhodocytophaga aerolata]|uniref:Endonuclease/exonuclease/phosphatase family protein n=1 Tax=Rhodocytophaga aerolata TaxID=455078 RepID=A0ABT8QZ51_9BACT|nr:endonuclease/exonuclease/phosphatase family protein [Rhodocytophaga aerolata]MDO1444949.1 endonuclease/exonuclease/phosphatase family protein [Rhodocytophaga aerolata]
MKHTSKTLLVYILSGIALFVAACSPRNLPATKRVAQNKPADPLTGQVIRVMAYNIHHSNPPSKPDYIDIEAITTTIRTQNPDLVALQEVDVHTDRSGPANQAEEIARKLNMHYYFGKAIDYGGGEYGVAILSKYPLSEQKVHRLPTQEDTKGEPRILATVKVTLPNGQEIRFGSTHLDAQKAAVNRELQIREIGKIASAETLPFIIAGDFNAPPESEVIRQLDTYFKRTCQPCAPTIPVENPTKAIDFIAYRPAGKFRVESHQVIAEKYASDHLPVVAEIMLSN